MICGVATDPRVPAVPRVTVSAVRKQLSGVLERLRGLLGDRTEQAYAERDAQGATNPQGNSYAAGEAHAYGVAEEDVRDAQKRDDEA